MSRVRIQRAGGTGVAVWHELEVDDEGRVECPLCLQQLPVATVVEHLQPPASGTIRPLSDDEEPVVQGDQWPGSW